MNWKQTLFWAITAALVYYFFLAFGVFLFQQQEESQLFIPQWWQIKDELFKPGGFCAIAGQFVIQYYRMPLLAITIQMILIIGCGVSFYHLLQKIKPAGYHLILAVFPLLLLLKMSIRSNYLVDGTIALFIFHLSLLPLTRINRSKTIALYGILSTILVFLFTGLLAICYAVIYMLTAAALYPTYKQKLQGLWSLIPAMVFLLFYESFNIPVSLLEGFKPESYLEIQLLPHYFIYYVWLQYSLLLVGILLVAFLLSFIPAQKASVKIILNCCCCIPTLLFGRYCMPDSLDMQNRMTDELAYLTREKQWDTIINRYKGRPIQDYISLNYLNMSLAQKGVLAENMFAFDQKGAKSLVAPWNQSLYMDKLLCDIHFMIGNLSLAESYAMDGFTQSKRKGSARMMQRLVQISLLRGEKEVAKKYIDLLSQMPFYKEWAQQYAAYLRDPEKMQEEPELKHKRIPQQQQDLLLSLMSTDSLWASYDISNRIGWEYKGCYYLLDKQLDKFRQYLTDTTYPNNQPWPRHYQEAWLILEEADSTLTGKIQVQPDIRKSYQRLKQLMNRHSQSQNMQAIYQEFGHTYWFYYYFKQFKSQK